MVAWKIRGCQTALKHLLSLLPGGLHRLCAGVPRQLRTQSETGTGFSIDTVVRRIGVGDALIPTHGGNPGGRCVEMKLRPLQRLLMAVNVQLDADSSRECFAHKDSIAQYRTNV
jgi:hypothetical protein